MNTIGGYFVNNINDGKCKKDNVILGKKYRITILTDRLVRLEYNPTGQFEDRPTQRVIFRNFDKVSFTATQSETLLQVATSYFTIDYVKEQSFIGSKVTPGNTLKVTLNGTDRVWYYNHPEARNFGTITYSLDDFKGKLRLDKGLYSTDGFAYIDDSRSLVLNENGTFSSRPDNVLDFYVFVYRKDLGLCLQDYYKLTGYPMMLPRYSFGNWWYKDSKYTNDDIYDFVKKIKEDDIPISVFMVGNKWHNDKDPFSIDTSIFDVANGRVYLSNNGIKSGVEVDAGKSIYNGTVSYQNMGAALGGGNSVKMLPIDNNKLNLYTNFVISNLVNNGIEVFLIGYNNKLDKVTLSLLNHYHYAYFANNLNKRSVVLVRNHSMAIHRYGVVMTGKTIADWNTLSILPRFNSSASNIGVSYVVNAIGGYYKGVENFELLIRYIQLGVFSPLLVLASDDGKYYRREPWRWNVSQKEIINKYLRLRNMLIPYIYTESYIYHTTGSPMLQPLYYKYPKIYDEPMYANQYFFGSQMLVCPITKKKNLIMNRVVQRLFIPEGVWYELESGKKYLGNKYYMSFYKDESYPVFCREGSIVVLSLDEGCDNPVNLEVDVFPGCNGSYNLYEDDGITFSYKSGTYAVTEFVFNYSKDRYDLMINPKAISGIVPDVRNYKIRFRNTNSASITVSDGTNNVKASAMLERNDLVIDIPAVPCGKNLVVTVMGTNIENSTMRLINDDIEGILQDLEIETILKEQIAQILFGELPIRKKRIAIRKLKRKGLEPKFIKMFLKLLEYIETV